jgi:hypothetical protein
MRGCFGLVLVLLTGSTAPAAAEIVRITDLNTTAIRALDRSKTVVILTGGMLEEHGPYLPAFTDGHPQRSADLRTVAGAGRQKPDWTILLFPQIPFGASGYNEIGGHYTFQAPTPYARPPYAPCSWIWRRNSAIRDSAGYSSSTSTGRRCTSALSIRRAISFTTPTAAAW